MTTYPGRALLYTVVSPEVLADRAKSSNSAVSGAAIQAKLMGLSKAIVHREGADPIEIPCDRCEVDDRGTLLCLSPDSYLLASFGAGGWSHFTLERPSEQPRWSLL